MGVVYVHDFYENSLLITAKAPAFWPLTVSQVLEHSPGTLAPGLIAGFFLTVFIDQYHYRSATARLNFLQIRVGTAVTGDWR